MLPRVALLFILILVFPAQFIYILMTIMTERSFYTRQKWWDIATLLIKKTNKILRT